MTSFNEIQINELVVNLKAKREWAFSTLFDNYAATLFSVATKFVCDKQVREDILQDVFVKIWRNIDFYDASKGTLFTWMLNITRNECIDYLRSKRHRYHLKVVDNGFESVDSNLLLSQINPDDGQELPYLIQNLDAKYREVIDLVYIYGYTQQEVAQMLDIPIGTVKTRCRNALMQLRRIYTI